MEKYGSSVETRMYARDREIFVVLDRSSVQDIVSVPIITMVQHYLEQALSGGMEFIQQEGRSQQDLRQHEQEEIGKMEQQELPTTDARREQQEQQQHEEQVKFRGGT